MPGHLRAKAAMEEGDVGGCGGCVKIACHTSLSVLDASHFRCLLPSEPAWAPPTSGTPPLSACSPTPCTPRFRPHRPLPRHPCRTTAESKGRPSPVRRRPPLLRDGRMARCRTPCMRPREPLARWQWRQMRSTRPYRIHRMITTRELQHALGALGRGRPGPAQTRSTWGLAVLGTTKYVLRCNI